MKDVDIQPWLIRMSQGDEEAFQIVYEMTRDHALEEIAQLLQIPIGSVKSRHQRALKRLRHQFQDGESGKGANEYVY